MDAFEDALRVEAPPVSRIDALESTSATTDGGAGFQIAPSTDAGGVPETFVAAWRQAKPTDEDGLVARDGAAV